MGPVAARWNFVSLSRRRLAVPGRIHRHGLSRRPLPPTFWTAGVIDEIRRVLKPGGRLICCVTEEDLAVRHQIASGLLLERVLGQSGARSESESPRWHEVQIDNPHERPSVDWWFFVAMKDPLSATAATYQERLYPHTAFPGGPNPPRYVGSFENPSSVFNIGAPVTRGTLLEQFCRDVIRESANSPDVAGAYCVLGYQLLEAPRPDSYFIRVWLSQVDACLRADSTTSGQPCDGVSRCCSLPVVWRCGHENNALALRSFQACMSEDRHESRRYSRRRRSKRRIGQGCCARATATAMRLENRGHGASRSRRAASGLKPNRHAI